jgi:hypothetical protein
MVNDGSLWYMFFEVLNEATRQGDIGLATSPDGYDWIYRQIVLDEPFHVSYPEVFQWQDRYYMIPETSEANEIRLYEAENFPTRWRFVRSILHGFFVDPTVVRYADQWWLFAQTNPLRDDTLRLYSAVDLAGPWVEHPASPLVHGDPNIARPAGRMLTVDGHLYRFAQECRPNYGHGVRAFEIRTLTSTAYKETPVEMPVRLGASGWGWNALGMHQVDAHLLNDGRWIACVDGHRQRLALSFQY